MGDKVVWVPAPKVEVASDAEENSALSNEGKRKGKARAPEGRPKCELCGKTFANKRKLTVHLQYVHTSIRPFVCEICSATFKRKQELKQHQHVVHDEMNRLFPCTICGYKAKHGWRLKDHTLRCHTNQYETSCNICGLRLKLKRDLTAHAKQMHSGPLVCESCGMTLPNYRSLHCHKVNRHGGGRAKVNRSFKCRTCCKAFVSQVSLDAHVLKDHVIRSYRCDHCSKFFTGKSTLTFHIHNVHSYDRPYRCPVCRKTFKTHSVLQLHLFSHTDVKPYRCDICGSSYTQRSSMMLHRRKHPGDLPPVPPVRLEFLLKSIQSKIDELAKNGRCEDASLGDAA